MSEAKADFLTVLAELNRGKFLLECQRQRGAGDRGAVGDGSAFRGLVLTDDDGYAPGGGDEVSTELSLYGLPENLLALLDTADMVPEEQRNEIECEIVRVQLQVEKKTDAVAGFIRHCEATEGNIVDEINRLQELRKHYRSGKDRVKGYVADIIRAAGKDSKGEYKPLEGRTSVMRLQASGGVQSLEIVQENAIPTHLGKFHGVIGEQHYRRLRELCGDDPNTLAELDRMTWHVDTGSVRAILEEPCQRCGGNGLMQDGSELPCAECGGEKTRRVPGARLLPRGESVVVR